MDWIPIVVAIVAASATLGVQFLVARGEPAAIKRLIALNQAIEGMPYGDEGRLRLELARTQIALRVGSSLIGVKGFARVLRIGGWAGLIIGLILFLGWLVFLLMDPKNNLTPASSSFGSGLIFVLFLAPALIVYSKLWPAFERDFRELTGILADRRSTKRDRRLSDKEAGGSIPSSTTAARSD